VTLIDYIESMRKRLKEGERDARRTQYRLTVKLVLLLAGALITTGTTARLIEVEREWWLITAAAVLTAVWARAASRAAVEVDDARRMCETIGHAADCLPDEELLHFLNTFMGGPPAPTTDEEPTPEEAPR
jgi:hypothetical protein